MHLRVSNIATQDGEGCFSIAVFLEVQVSERPMSVLRIKEFISDPLVISRESARLLREPIRRLLEASNSHVESLTEFVADFEGVAGLASGFFDELVREYEAAAARARKPLRIVVFNPPAPLSSKFEAIARSHAMHARQEPDGSWILDSS